MPRTTSPQPIAIVDKNQMWVVSGNEVLPLPEIGARIVILLSKASSPMSGSQISRELQVTGSAVTKSARKLVDLGLLKKDSLPISKNIKVYSLAVNIMDETKFAKVREQVPTELIQEITHRLGGHEKLALAFLDQLLDLTGRLGESDRNAVLKLFTQRVAEQ